MADATLNVDHFIAMDRQSIRLQIAAGLPLLAIGGLGLAGTFTKLVEAGNPDVELIGKGVSLIVTLIGLFPFKTCWERWQRVQMLEAIKADPAALDAEHTHELIYKLYQKLLGV
jgi:hypothetical protein